MLRSFRSGWAQAFLLLLALDLAALAWWTARDVMAGAPTVRVVSVLPEAPDGADALVVRFDRPLAAGAELGEPLAAPPFAIEPRVQGVWRWIAEDALELGLEQPLAPGRDFELAPAADFEARTGHALLGARSFALETRPAELLAIELSSSDEQDATLLLRFDHPVSPEELARCLELRLEGRPGEVGLDADACRRVDASVLPGPPATELRARFAHGGAPAARVRVAAGLRALEAQRGSAEAREERVELARGLVLLGVRAHAYAEVHSAVATLRFSRTLDASQAPEVALEPPVEGLQARVSGSELLLEGRFVCGRGYRATVGEALLARDGTTLGRPLVASFDVPHRAVSISLPDSSGVLSPRGNLELALRAVNAEGLDVQLHRVHDSNLVAHVRGEGSAATARALATRRLALAPEPDRIQHLALDLRSLLPEPRGVYELVVTPTNGRRWDRERALVRVTDLALTARRERGGFTVWASSIASAEPLAGVAVEARSYNDQLLGGALTGPDGIARLDLPDEHPDGAPYLLVARRGEELSYLQPDRRLWTFDGVDTSGRRLAGELDAWLYGERDVYRPGDTLHLTGILRGRDGAVPPPTGLALELQRPDGRRAFEGSVRAEPSQQGAFQLDVETLESWPTGRYVARLAHEDEELARFELLLEAFEPVRIELTAELAEHLAPGDARELALAARSLLGGPAAELAYSVATTLRARTPRFEGLERFSFEPDQQPTPKPVALVEGRLDADGRARVALPIPSQLAPARWALHTTATVTEIGGRSSSTAREATLDTAPRHVGLSAGGREVVDAHAPLALEWTIVDGAGRPAGGAPLELELYRVELEWKLVSVGGSWSWRSEEQLERVARVELGASDTERGLGELALELPRPGRYRALARDVELDRRTKLELHAVRGAVAGAAKPEQPDQVELVPERRRVRPGESVSVLVNAPFEGTLLLALEDERVRWSEVRALGASSARIEVPIPADARGGLWLSASVVRPLAAREASWLPHRARGLARLETAHDAQRASVELVHEPVLRPGAPATVEVATDLAPGALVHVWGVDSGVYLVGARRAPDPFAHFLGRRARSIGITDTHAELLPDFARPEGTRRIGGDGGEDPLARRRSQVAAERREPAVAWSRFVPVDAAGRARVTLEVPDFLGELRLFCVAVGGDRYGAAQASARVTTPVAVVVSTPRFLAPGDEATLPLELRNASAAPAMLTLRLETEGGVEGELEEARFELAPGERRVVDAHLRADRVGPAAVVAVLEGEVAGEPVLERRRAPFPVRRGTPLASRTLARRIEAGAPVELDLTAGFAPERLRLRVRAGADPALELAPAFDQVLGYPYGCGEQTTSRILALLARDDEVALEPIRAGIDRLAAMRTASGGLAYWAGGREASPWVSAYAARALVGARRLGVENAPLLEGLLEHLERSLAEERDANQRAHMARALAEAQRPPLGWMARLSEAADELDPEGRAQLALAWLAAGRRDCAEPLLTEELLAVSVPTTGAGRLTSTATQRAVLLEALVALDPAHPWAPALASTLLAARADGRWGSTLENASALSALARYQRESQPASFTGALRVGAVERALTSAAPLELELDRPDGPLSIALEGSGHLALVATVEGELLAGAPELDRGIAVRRRWLGIDGLPLDPRALRVGELVVVELALRSLEEVSVPAVAVVDALPGGLEVENPRLAISAEIELPKGLQYWDPGAAPSGARDTRPIEAAARPRAATPRSLPPLRPERVELLDDRVVLFATATPEWRVHRYALRAIAAGRFELPPLQASSMYAATLSSIRGAGRVEVAR